jgi:hypothetical protein
MFGLEDRKCGMIKISFEEGENLEISGGKSKKRKKTTSRDCFSDKIPPSWHSLLFQI